MSAACHGDGGIHTACRCRSCGTTSGSHWLWLLATQLWATVMDLLPPHLCQKPCSQHSHVPTACPPRCQTPPVHGRLPIASSPGNMHNAHQGFRAECSRGRLGSTHVDTRTPTHIDDWRHVKVAQLDPLGQHDRAAHRRCCCWPTCALWHWAGSQCTPHTGASHQLEHSADRPGRPVCVGTRR